MFWSIIIGNWNKTRKFLFLHGMSGCITAPHPAQCWCWGTITHRTCFHNKYRTIFMSYKSLNILYMICAHYTSVLPITRKKQAFPLHYSACAEGTLVLCPLLFAPAPAFESIAATKSPEWKGEDAQVLLGVWILWDIKKKTNLQDLNQ